MFDHALLKAAQIRAVQNLSILSPRSDEPLWVFLHMPKTAGSSLRHVIEQNVSWYRAIKIYRGRYKSTMEMLSRERYRLRHARIVYGHIPAIVHDFTDRECRYFTILRDPVERVLSLYKFIKYDFPKHNLHERFQREKNSLDRWLEQQPNMASNAMTRLIAGYEIQDKTDVETVFGQACTNLQAMQAVGIQEQFPASVELICKTIGWHSLPANRNRSSMSNREFIAAENISTETLEKIRTINRCDLELYEIGKALLKEKLEERSMHSISSS